MEKKALRKVVIIKPSPSFVTITIAVNSRNAVFFHLNMSVPYTETCRYK